MNLRIPDDLPAWAMALGLAAHVAVGAALGVLYFRVVWWSAHRLALGGRPMATAALIVGRFAALGGLLTLASLEGALPLLATALGVLIGRSAFMRRAGKAAT